MPSKTEHSISITGDTYAAFKRYCKTQGIPMNAMADSWVQEFAPFTDVAPRKLLRDKKGRFLRYGDDLSTATPKRAKPKRAKPKRTKPEGHPIDPPPVDRERVVETKGSDIVQPSSEGLVPFKKKPARTGGYNEF